MKSAYLQFLTRIFLFTVIIGIVAYGIQALLPDHLVTPALPFLIPFFLSVSLIVHYVLLKGNEKKNSTFVNYFMLTAFLKIVFYMLVLVVYILLNRLDAGPFIVTYFIFYICYTSFEIISFYQHNKKQKIQDNNTDKPKK